jgi:hypothetical protein
MTKGRELLDGETATRIRQATGREPRPAKSVFGLENLPLDVLQDMEAINSSCGGIYVFAYLHHVTDATFSEVKAYADSRGWHHSAD